MYTIIHVHVLPTGGQLLSLFCNSWPTDHYNLYTCRICIIAGIMLMGVLISSYGTPLAQRAFYLELYSSLLGPDGAVNYDCIVTNIISSLLIGSTCILKFSVDPIWPLLQIVF